MTSIINHIEKATELTVALSVFIFSLILPMLVLFVICAVIYGAFKDDK